jgi:hypothetical protein
MRIKMSLLKLELGSHTMLYMQFKEGGYSHVQLIF